MIKRINDETTGGRNTFQATSEVSVFLLIWVFLLISARSMSTTFDASDLIDRSMMETTVTNASMPLWGGPVSLNMSLSTSGIETEMKLHHFDQISCGNCHAAPGTTETSLVSGDIDMKSTVNINRSCTSFGCHEYDQALNHPIGVPVSPILSAQTVSNASSELTCLTCHEGGSVSVTNDSDDRVLVSPALTVCQSCHELSGDSQKERAHWRFSQKAHLVPLIPGSTMDNHGDNTMMLGIDDESQTCLTCHDEITANISGMSAMGRSMSRRQKGMSDHPIGMDYQDALSTQSHLFHLLENNQQKLRMFDGKIGCGTCHSLYSPTQFHLAVTHEKSKLCRTCHNR